MNIVGWNIYGFDLPYLYNSSVRYGVQIPWYVKPTIKGGRVYHDNSMVDLMPLSVGGKFQEFKSLENFCKQTGFPGGKEFGKGKDFYKLELPLKKEYLENDLRMTRHAYDTLNKALQFSEEAMAFDLETEPMSLEEIERISSPFDPANVKTGNLKDPFKIQEKIEQAEMNYLENLQDKAGLDAYLSKPVAIGYHWGDEYFGHHSDDPVEILKKFWELADTVSTKYRERNTGI